MPKFSRWTEAKKTIACGECFPFANNLAREMVSDGIIPESQIKVCHGTIIEPFARDLNRHVHAWVETKDRCHDWQLRVAGKGSMTKGEYYDLFKPQDVKRYSPEESMILMVRNRHHGPWD